MAPFPDCTVAEKLLRHQVAEPKPVDQLRTDLPANLGLILRRMMAKQPEDRYQTPREIAEALAAPPVANLPVLIGSHSAAPIRHAAAAPVAVLVVDGKRSAMATPSQRFPVWARAASAPRQQRRLLAGCGGAIFIVALLMWVLVGGGATPPAYLADLPMPEVGPGEFSKDGTRRVSVDGKLATKGFFVFPPDNGTAYARFRLGKKYKFLKTTVSLNDGAQDCTPLTFTVSLDGKKSWESRPITKKGDRQECDLNIEGADVLELAVTCPGPRTKGWPWTAHAAWIDPIVRR